MTADDELVRADAVWDGGSIGSVLTRTVKPKIFSAMICGELQNSFASISTLY